MADASVESLIEYLHQIQIHQADLISNAKDLVDIDKLENDLRLIKAFIEKRRQDGGVRLLLRQIRDVVYGVEDIINASMTEAADANSENYFLRAFQTSEMLRSICQQIDSISADIKDKYVGTNWIDFTSLGVGDERPILSKAPRRQLNVVGVEDEAKNLIERLTKEAEHLDIVTVIGVAGLGKTTLAWKVFGDPAIKYEFPTRIWIYVSGHFTKKDIFLSILREFMRLPEVVCADRGFEPPLVSDARNCHRLCVHSDADTLDFLSSKPYGPRIRSFICFSKDEINLPLQKISAIPAAFKLLRVLEAAPIKFTKVPRNLYHLIHLKYIAISFSLSILPAAFSKFWNIQTLVVNTTSYTLEVKADIWNMIQLRHFKTNASATLPSSTEGGKSEKLQTLGTISPQSCSEEVFNKASNLKKLSIRGQLSSLLDGNNGSFGSLKKLVNLEKLKLLNGVFYSIEEGQLPGLPPASEFPPKLRSLTLSNTFLEWSHMSILGSLKKLEVLKLKDYAFVGEKWEATDGGFRSLEVLHIGCTNLVNWKASSHHFPKLRWLELRNCEELCEVPIELADIPSLQILGLYRTTTAAASAVKVEEVKRNLAQQSSGANAFELSIFPPNDS
ncbi:hypothetical protein C2S53_015028 [Perilla frutescens var. hirtella]|uniref:Uncharacterized protein n=1 Tax=Perilla frutescens var. hirtella TaxID=608512 RepID=A0AAD4P830_PERFH|nr:hypothetical protein C2S53_015028 [Perilla frutescens var. hirtella]